MNETAFYLEPEFWVTVSFVMFVLLAFRPVAEMIAKTLDSRSALIGEELSQARKLREEAQETLKAYQKKQQESLEEAALMLKQTQEDAKRMAAQAETELKSALEKRMKLATDKIAQAETKALQDVQNHVVDIAIAAARTIIAEHLSRGGNEELIKQAALELERKLH
jgi:F-type H+-transporting ATPase subunit b